MDKNLASFLLHLHSIGAIQVAEPDEGFVFKHHEKDPSAPRSPIKFHLCTPQVRREGKLSPADISVIGRCMADLVLSHNIRFRGIAGLPNVGDPIADAIADDVYQRGIVGDVGIIRLQKITEGNRRYIGPIKQKGNLLPRETVLVVDDLAFAATTKEEGIEQVRAEFHAPYCVVFLDYDVGAREALQKLKATLLSVATVGEVLHILHSAGKLTPEQYERCRSFLAYEKDRRLTAAA